MTVRDKLCVHTAEDSKYQEGRIIQCFMYLRIGSVQDNHYAHPLDLLVYVDMNTGRILDTWMYPEPPSIPQMKANYIAPLVQNERGFRTGDQQCVGRPTSLSVMICLFMQILPGNGLCCQGNSYC